MGAEQSVGRRLGGLILVPVLVVVAWVGVAAVVYPPEYVRRVVLWRTSDVDDYLHNFEHQPLTASPDPFAFPVALDDDAADYLAKHLGAVSLDDHLTQTQTQGLVVIHRDRIVVERYVNGWERDSLVTSFSVAKSFVSTLVGMAIEDGHIGSVDDPITEYLPELAERDLHFERITIRHLLTMSSGLDYAEMRWGLFNGDDPLTTYHPDQRDLCLNQPTIAGEPDRRFVYHKCHPQLLGMILERATGESVTEYTQRRLWDPLGMEYDGSWSLDSAESGFEKLEAGLNARVIDYAKLGRLFLREGNWDGEQLLSPRWVALASGTSPAGRAPDWDEGGERYYGFMWWGWERADGGVDYAALGDRGQYLFVSPVNDVIIVRNGVDYGADPATWRMAFQATADHLGADL